MRHWNTMFRLAVLLMIGVCANLAKSAKLERAVPLCLPDEDGDETLLLQEDGLDVLSKIGDDPVVVISITGQARTGKSYFLSRMSDNAKFEVGHGMDGKTAGIWISANTEMLERDGGKARLVLLDTEGIGSITSDRQTIDKWDTSIVSLSTLISSELIYSSQKPSLSDLQKLDFFSMFSETMRNCSDDGSLTWLITNNVVTLKSLGYDSWAAWFENKVFKQTGDQSASDTFKEGIRKMFPKFDAVALPSPSNNPELCENLDSEDEEVKEELKNFLTAVNDAAYKIVSKAAVKRVLGEPMTGNLLRGLIVYYVDNINSEGAKFPWETAFQSALHSRCVRHSEECEKHFDYKLAQINLSRMKTLRELKAEFVTVTESTLDYFNGFKIVIDKIRIQHLDKLKSFMNTASTELYKKWARIHFDALVKKLESELSHAEMECEHMRLEELVKRVGGIREGTFRHFYTSNLDNADPEMDYQEMLESNMTLLEDHTIRDWLEYNFQPRREYYSGRLRSIDLQSNTEQDVYYIIQGIRKEFHDHFEADYSSPLLGEYRSKIRILLNEKEYKIIGEWKEIHRWDNVKKAIKVAGTTAGAAAACATVTGPVGAALCGVSTLFGSWKTF